MDTSEHRLASFAQDEGSRIWVIKCACGWQSRAAAIDCLAFLDTHVARQAERTESNNATPSD